MKHSWLNTRDVTIQEKRIAIYRDIFSLYCDILRYIALINIFSKIQLISQYLSKFLTLHNRIRIIYMHT